MKTQMIRLSIIIPMYQSEKLISECLQSILTQHIDELEILCIDDGSTDRTCSIVNEYIKRDNRIHLIRHPHHSGVSKMRNIGIEIAQGNYLLFLDSDDMLCKRKLKKVLQRAEREKADILVFGGKTSAPLETPFWIREAFSPRNKIYKAFHPITLMERGARPSAGNKLYKKQMLSKYNIKFDEDLALAEDHVFQFYIFPCMSKIVFFNCRLYYYRIHQQNSAVAKSQQNSEMRISSHLLAMKKIYEAWKKYGYWKNPAFRQLYCDCYMELLFDELYSLPKAIKVSFAANLYKNITGYIDNTINVSKNFEKKVDILYLYAKNEIDLAEYQLKELQKRPCFSRLFSPFRYLHMVGFRSCLEHYIGKIQGKKEY